MIGHPVQIPKMPSQKILFVASDYRPRPGGRAEYIDNLARGLISLGTNAIVLGVVQPHHREQFAFLKGYEQWAVPFEVTHDQRPQNWIGNKAFSFLEIVRCLSATARPVLERVVFPASAASVARFEQVLVKERPDAVIFGHLDLRLYPFALHLLKRRTPYGIIVHGREVPYNPDKKNDFIRRRSVLAGATWIIANSRDTESLLQVWRIPQSKLSIVYPPVSKEAIVKGAAASKMPISGAKRLQLLTLCRLVKGKAIDIVLRALKLLTERGIPFHYVIGGDGSERMFLEALVDELGLRSVVRFAGYLTGDEKWSALEASDVFVMPSRQQPTWVESFGIAFIEAAAFGLPTVGSNSGGISDAVVDGETGILVPEESPEHLADALAFLYANPQRRMEMGKAGMERAQKRFSPAAIASQFQEEIFHSRSLLSVPAGAPARASGAVCT